MTITNIDKATFHVSLISKSESHKNKRTLLCRYCARLALITLHSHCRLKKLKKKKTHTLRTVGAVCCSNIHKSGASRNIYCIWICTLMLPFRFRFRTFCLVAFFRFGQEFSKKKVIPIPEVTLNSLITFHGS